MTTPQQIIAKIEEIEKMLFRIHEDIISPIVYEKLERDFVAMVEKLKALKVSAIDYYDLPTADPPEGSPGQEDMEG